MPKVKRKQLAEQANAIHEAGHAVARWIETVLPGVKSVSIIPRKKTLGQTVPKSKKWERSLASEEHVRARIRVSLAGRAAEVICLGKRFLGSRDDITQATALAYLMMATEGMDKDVGPTDVERTAESEYLLKKIDRAIERVKEEEHANILNKLRERKQDILKVAFALLEHKELKTKDLKKILGKRPKWKAARGLLMRQRKNNTREKS